MRRLICKILSCLVAIGFFRCEPAQKATIAEKPNILFIFIDDLGWPTMGCYGNTMVPTPAVNRLAEEGIKFTDAYVTPQCTPSRASLLSGQHTARNKMWHVIPGYGLPYARLQEPEYLQGLPRETETVAERLQKAGYKTAILGKWHLHNYNSDGYYTRIWADSAKYHGFDYVEPVTEPTEYQSRTDKGVHFLTDEAISFMERNREQPFFIYLSHHTIHNPVLAPDSLVQKYLDQGYPAEGLHNATYLAALEHIDHSVERLLKSLDELGIADNTLVVFYSDNGGIDYLFDNAPLRYGKGSAYEGGIRVPLLMRWPAGIEAGQVIEEPVHVVDMYPTLVDLAGGTLPENQVVDGLSLVPLITEGEFLNRESLFWYMPLYDLQWGAVPAAVIRKGDYKLIRFFGDYYDLDQAGKYIPEGRVELYNLEEDIGEEHDLAAEMPQKKEELLQELNNWLQETGVELPSPNPDYNQDSLKVRAKVPESL